MNTVVYIVLVFIISYIFFLLNFGKLTYIKSEVDGNFYLVNDLPDKQQAANLLGEIRNSILRLLKVSNTSTPYFDTLRSRFNDIKFMENPVLRPNHNMTSYSINKGDRMVLCLREPVDLKLHPINTIMYVVIHECAHVACPEIGHTPLFLKIFADLLTDSISAGIYKDENYKLQPVSYCGIKIAERVI